MRSFDPGYAHAPYAALVGEHPGPETYPPREFRVEWGPIFHRGRLDGTARVLVIGQDPATHEAITRRILVGTAGRRFQGFLHKLGIDTSYVLINTYLYSVYGQQAGNAHADDPDIARYRHRWLDTLVTHNRIEAVISLGGLANTAFDIWRNDSDSAPYDGAHAHILHPTYPDSASASGTDYQVAMRRLLKNWNSALTTLSGAVTPDVQRPLDLYGEAFTPSELAVIPEADLPAGLPSWMRSDETWAARKGAGAEEKRATIVVRIPEDERPF
ncbi:uracil-DNA glycosylase family protein [Streptomyces sp. NPDC058653]|uniref:uracil-DNA glycosylase family protein n=1 Tax=Streptomyces sp. NPDC058653 TaxID=3346576 RepID=UPI003663C319